MHYLTMKSDGISSKRRSRTNTPSRRFSVNDMKKKEIIPISKLLPTHHSNMLPNRKVKQHAHARRGFRMIFSVAFFFIVMSTVSVWRSRAQLRIQSSFIPQRPSSVYQENHPPIIDHVISQQQETTGNNDEHGQTQQQQQHIADDENKETGTTGTTGTNTINEKENEGDVQSGHELPKTVATLPMEDPVPERFEWYTRTDFKDGQRPICRITHPLILSNGSLFLPDWMERHQTILKRCNIGNYQFYTPEVPPLNILKTIHDVDHDFALTNHLDKFQQPTHDIPVFLTEHIMKSSYLFEIFSGLSSSNSNISEKYCYALVNGSQCADMIRPKLNGLKPAIFIPSKFEKQEKEDWVNEIMNLVGTAYSNDNGIGRLNLSEVIKSEHKDKSEDLIGTRFRSVLAMDGMFRHLPDSGLKDSRLFSSINGIQKEKKTFNDGDGKCNLNIGIASSKILGDDEELTFRKADGLKTNLQVMIKFAIPQQQNNINIDITDLSENVVHIPEIVKTLNNIDIFISASGSDLNNIGFLKHSSIILELLPFGIKPIVHKSLATILGLNYQYMRGRPQDEVFKKCIEHEAGKSNNGPPIWEEPLRKAWDNAVAEFTLTGTSKFDVLKGENNIRNYQSRICALKQPVDVRLEDAARKVLHMVKDKCGMPNDERTHEEKTE